MINKQLFLILLISLGVILVTIISKVEPGQAQGPDGGSPSQTIEPNPSATLISDSGSLPQTAEPNPTTLSTSDVLSPTETVESAPSTTPLFELTTAGWLESGSLEPASAISAQALNPVDCALLTPPVVGFEISRGQNPNDIADFSNDLSANGFSLGTVDLGSGTIPACVNVLIIHGSTGGTHLSSAYTVTDGALLKAWTSSGHGLMLSGEFGTFRMEIQELFLAYGYSQQGPGAVSDPTDFDPAGPANPPNTWVIYQTDNFAGHPIFNGVASAEFLASSWLTPAANGIMTSDADTNPAAAPVMAAFKDGLGCVALSTDSNWTSVVGTVNGYFKQDNARIARQTVQWLNGCAPLSLKLSKIANPSPIQVGGLLTYTLTISNDSAAALTNVTLTDTVPLSTAFVSASGLFTGPAATGEVSWSLGALKPNSSTAVAMVVQVDSHIPTGTVVANTAWASSAEGITSTATTLTPVIVQVADPLVTKAVNTSQAQVGDVVTFTLTVQQASPSSSNATNVQVVDSLTPELDILGPPQVTDGSITVNGQVITWTIPVLTPTDIQIMTIQAQVNNSRVPPLTINNQAVLSFEQGSPRSSNPVEILVPAGAPPPDIPSSPDPDKQNDNDNDNTPSLPPAAPVPAITVSDRNTPTPQAMPVAFLPETGYQSSYPPLIGWPLAGLGCLGLIGLFLPMILFGIFNRLSKNYRNPLLDATFARTRGLLTSIRYRF